MAVRLAMPDDYPAIAAVLRAEMEEYAPTLEELAHQDAAHEPGRYFARLIVATDSQIVGAAAFGHDDLAHRECKFTFDLRVHPDYQGQGYGKALYNAMLDEIAPLQPRELVTMVYYEVRRAIRFLQDRGFVEVWRRVGFRLDARSFDDSPYLGLESRLQADGFTITTYDQLANDAEREAKLHALNEALWLDVPYGEALSARSLDNFVQGELRSPEFLPTLASSPSKTAITSASRCSKTAAVTCLLT
jgi:ribosomal protein S18 acetylase RimI-like enzyme